MSELALTRPGAVGILFGEGGDIEAFAYGTEPGDYSETASTGDKDFADAVPGSLPTGKGEPGSLGKLQKINDDLPSARGEGARRGINSRDHED
jgi:hypothetical protein